MIEPMTPAPSANTVAVSGILAGSSAQSCGSSFDRIRLSRNHLIDLSVIGMIFNMRRPAWRWLLVRASRK
jgi:hypothetical protein